MKKIIAIVLNIVSVILTGIAFGLGALPMAYAYKKIDTDEALTTQIGNYYETTWVKGAGNFSVGCLILFFVLCVGALIVTIAMFMNSKKYTIVNALAALLLLAAGVMIFFIPQLYLMGHPDAAKNITYVLGGGSISMGVLLLCAGVFQAVKVVLTCKED